MLFTAAHTSSSQHKIHRVKYDPSGAANVLELKCKKAKTNMGFSIIMTLICLPSFSLNAKDQYDNINTSVESNKNNSIHVNKTYA